MKKIIVASLFFIISLAACEQNKLDDVKHVRTYDASFDVAQIESVETIMESIAKKYELRISHNDRDGMKYLTDEKEAFAIFLHFKDNVILAITNVGVGNAVMMMVNDYGDMPAGNLEKIEEDVKNRLKDELYIEFKVNPNMGATS